jgi:hypothetical protein
MQVIPRLLYYKEISRSQLSFRYGKLSARVRRDDQVDHVRFLSQTARAKLAAINQQRVSGREYRFICAMRRANHDYLHQLSICMIGRRVSHIIPGVAHVYRLYTG